MTNLFTDEKTILLDNLLEEGGAAQRAKQIASERRARDDEHAKEFESLFSEQLLVAEKRLAPSEELREKYYKAFRGFQTWLGEIAPLPYHGSTIGLYLFHLWAIDRRPLEEVKNAADGIVFVHQQRGFHINPAWINVVFDVANEIAGGGGDDGGGNAASDPPPPLAATGAL